MKLKYNKALSKIAFNCNLCRYIMVNDGKEQDPDQLRADRENGEAGGKSGGLHIPGAEGTAMFFCPGLVARVPQDYLNDQLQGILATSDNNDLDDDGEFVDPEEEASAAVNSTDEAVPMNADAMSTSDATGVDLDSPECDAKGGPLTVCS